MPLFFIRHPIIAIVAALLVVLAGTVAGLTLPVAQYPQITLPTIHISTLYQGADAEAVEQSVAQPIEKVVNGVDGMQYLSSTSSGSGQYAADVTFKLGVNPDIAAVQVQNRAAQANASLPSDVLNVGVTTQKSSPDTLMYIAFGSPRGTFDSLFLNNYVSRYVVDALKRVKGVGNVQTFGADFAMRIWLRPDRMTQLGLTPRDIADAVAEQNAQAPAGSIGQYPAPRSQQFQYGIKVKGRLSDPAEFSNIIVRVGSDGSMTRMKDIATIELGGLSYNTDARVDGKQVALIGINLTPDASAVETAGLVRAALSQLADAFPQDMRYDVLIDNTTFIKASLMDVVLTLVEALVLVLVVVFLFLQSWRATLIPMLAIPVSLLGTLAAFVVFGFTLNTLTLFAMVLAIGIVVDDAIVVVEAAEHQMSANGLSPRDATAMAMGQVTGPVIAVALVLSAVFVPCAFLGGISGAMYRQFALTVAVSTILSALVALTLTPALCALLLRPHVAGTKAGLLTRLFDRFNAGFEKLTAFYVAGVRQVLKRALLGIVVLGGLSVLGFGLMARLPGEFVPDEDQGYFLGTIQLPEAASLNRTMALSERFAAKLRAMPGVAHTLTVSGYDIMSGASKPNAAVFFVPLKPWDDRGTAEGVGALLRRTFALSFSEPGARIIPLNPPPIPGLGAAGGLSLVLQQRANGTPEELAAVEMKLTEEAGKQPELARLFPQFNPFTPAFQLDMDRDKAKQLGVSINDVSGALQTYLGGVQLNDFNAFGSTYKVVMQAAPEFRTNISELSLYSVRNGAGSVVPLSTLVVPKPINAPTIITRYNLFRSASISASPATGYSTGQAMAAMEKVAARVLPAGYTYEWTGLSLQEEQTSGQIVMVFALAVLIVFLVLTALYESWATPFSVLLAVPLSVLGAMLGLTAVGLTNNLYAQIGLILLVGLTAKNAILIVEFAKLKREEGASAEGAALNAAKLRLRPILMTSFAFIFGVAPMIFASGAGAASRVSMGITVCIGMAVGTAGAIFAVPLLFVLFERVRNFSQRPR
jgi:hydrophobe/amphiphile efflux-1 (HAE1) family protein